MSGISVCYTRQFREIGLEIALIKKVNWRFVRRDWYDEAAERLKLEWGNIMSFDGFILLVVWVVLIIVHL